MTSFNFEANTALGEDRQAENRNFSNGFGMVEVVVSILVLAVLSISIVPVLSESIRISKLNSKIAAANQLLGDQLDELKSINSCTGLQQLATNLPPAIKLGVTTGLNQGQIPIVIDDLFCGAIVIPSNQTLFIEVNDIPPAKKLASAFVIVNIESN